MIYTAKAALPAWGAASYDSSLVEVVDARAANFGEQLLTVFKQHARIEYTNDDTILPMYIDAAIMQIEQALEFPILPRSFDWNVGEATGYSCYEVPFRNSDAVGQQYDFEPLRGWKLMLPPTSWPVTLAIGFDSADDLPADLKLYIFDIAATLEQMRSTAEIASANIPQSIISRYLVLRC